MAYIAVFRETESGQILAEFDPEGLDFRIVKAAPDRSVCLRFIDPYGDLVINQIQLPVLIKELYEVREQAAEEELRDHIEGLIRFLKESNEPGVHIRFAGD